MPRDVVPASRLRTRMTVAFIIVAGVSAAALATGSYLLVRESRLDDSFTRAEQATRRNLALAAEVPISGGAPGLRGYVESFQRERGVPAVLLLGEEAIASNPTLDVAIPAELRSVVARGEIGFQRFEVGGIPQLVVGGRPDAGVDAELYFLFSEERLFEDLADLRNVLLLGLALVILVSGLAGRAVAARTLQPVATASRAARSIAEGLLDTRLPVGGRDEFGSWASSFNEMAEALEAKISALTEAQARERRFTSDVAHELRTPLTAIVSEASLLREHLDEMPPEARRPAELLVADVSRLRRLVEELMEISRLDAGRTSVRLEPVDLRSLLGGMLRTRAWESRVALEADEAVLQTDRRRLERIVGNLVGNALEHAGRDVAVRAGRDGTGVFVEVSDRGRGIAPEHLGHLFERFYKADPARTGPGSGLGLNIALENARLLGGDIEVWSEPGEGTRFTLRIPVT